MQKLEGKVAVVTASTKGIGFAIAKKLAEDGANVVISSRKQSNVEKAVETLKSQSLNVSGLVCHASKSKDRQKLFDRVKKDFGKLDILVSNAAVNPYFGPTLETPERVFDKIIDVNVKATFMLIKEFTPLMEKSQNPSVTMVSTISAFDPFDQIGLYSISKAALIGLTKVLAKELVKQNIRVNCLCPGIVKTEFGSVLWQNNRVAKSLKKLIPLGFFAKADECSGIVAFLSSDEATYITGENIVVGGAMLSRL